MKNVLAILVAVALSGCAEVKSIESSFTTLTPAQKVQLVTQVINGLCVVSASGLSFSGSVNAIVHPNATAGGSGASTVGTLTKASAIDALSCQALNGVTATLAGATATVAVQ